MFSCNERSPSKLNNCVVSMTVILRVFISVCLCILCVYFSLCLSYSVSMGVFVSVAVLLAVCFFACVLCVPACK